MPDSFIYQPHVHTSHGVLTPDLVVDRLLLAAGPGTKETPLGLNLLGTANRLDDPTLKGCGSAALVLFSGGRGAVVTVGSAHWDASYEDAAIVSEQLSPKLVAREAVRLDVLVRNRATARLSTYRLSTGAEARIGETPVDGLPGMARLIERWLGASAPSRTALLVTPHHVDPEPLRATGYRVALTGLHDAADITLTYAVRRLVA